MYITEKKKNKQTVLLPHEDTNYKYSFLHDLLCTRKMLLVFHLQSSRRLLIRNLNSGEDLQRFNKHVIVIQKVAIK